MTNADELPRESAPPRPGSKLQSGGEIEGAPHGFHPSTAKAKTHPEAPRKRGLTLLEKAQRGVIIQVLKETGGNKLIAARRLGIGRQTLYNKIEAFGIKVLKDKQDD